jgi:ubiquinone/menaquinone biosynthesis C-methylase UbiE
MTTSFEHDSGSLAETYDRVGDLQFEGGRRLVERLGLDEGARVLDVGCGTGRLTHWIAERVGTKGVVIGIDPLEERIRIARSHGGGVRFEVGQAEDLGAFEDASFDAVCMSSVLHWVAEKARALAEVRRVLRPGGRLGVTTSPHELAGAGTLRLVLDPLLAREPYAGRVDRSRLTFAKRGCTTTDLVSLVLESGLELVELHVTQSTQTHASGEALVAFVEASAFGTFLRPVAEDLRPLLRADLVAAFDARRGPAGVALRSWGVLFIAARAREAAGTSHDAPAFRG